jgi:hypothetical protein
MNKENPEDDAGIMADVTIQACDKLVEKVWLKVLQEGPMDLDDMVKCTVVLANCVSIVTMVIDHAEDFVDDMDVSNEDSDNDTDEDDED